MKDYNVVLADDHMMFRLGIKKIIEEMEDLKVIGEANDGHELLGLLNSLAPDMVILGGGVMAAGKIILENVRKNLPAYTLREPRENCRIAATRLGEHAGVVGCGALVFRNLGSR